MEIIFEMQVIGGILRVTAVDVATGTEVITQMPPSIAIEDAKKLARRKLEYVLNKRAESS